MVDHWPSVAKPRRNLRPVVVIPDDDDLTAGKGQSRVGWALVHLVEESRRHADHADILGDQIDGLIGR
jgi:hypothetical protein